MIMLSARSVILQTTAPLDNFTITLCKAFHYCFSEICSIRHLVHIGLTVCHKINTSRCWRVFVVLAHTLFNTRNVFNTVHIFFYIIFKLMLSCRRGHSIQGPHTSLRSRQFLFVYAPHIRLVKRIISSQIFSFIKCRIINIIWVVSIY